MKLCQDDTMDVLQFVIGHATSTKANPRMMMDTTNAPWSTFGELRPVVGQLQSVRPNVGHVVAPETVLYRLVYRAHA